jgi:NNP family nitrate/nitrite transporter-like MFS transporter
MRDADRVAPQSQDELQGVGEVDVVVHSQDAQRALPGRLGGRQHGDAIGEVSLLLFRKPHGDRGPAAWAIAARFDGSAALDKVRVTGECPSPGPLVIPFVIAQSFLCLSSCVPIWEPIDNPNPRAYETAATWKRNYPFLKWVDGATTMVDLKARKATHIHLFSFSTPPMRAFHMAWMAFFVCFFAWFAVAPLMPLIKEELGLSKGQIANINIASVGITVLVRMLIGPLSDKYGPRRVHTALLALGSIPVLGIATAHSYGTFLFFRLLIGSIGASFVITQYHTSVMFAPNVVGSANAASAGWGNAGGGVTQSVMPWVLAAVLSLGISRSAGWRLSMVVPAALMLIVAAMYWKFTQDCPQGDYAELRSLGVELESGKKGGWAVFKKAMGNYRAWMLFVTYGACFGTELFVHNVAASYYVDRFKLDLQSAGLAAGSFGLLALFARAVGGIVSDRVARTRGLDARTRLLFVFMIGEGLGLLWFSRTDTAATAIVAMITFGLFTHMACGSTYALVPFIDRKALGGVAGLVGAGGNVGAVAAGLLLKQLGNVQECFGVLGISALLSALCAVAIRFPASHKEQENALYEKAIEERRALLTAVPVLAASSQG